MSDHTKKHHTIINAKDPVTGQEFNASVRIGGKMDSVRRHRLRKAEKARRAQLKVFKERIRAAKKTVPLEQRSKVNWTQLEDELGL